MNEYKVFQDNAHVDDLLNQCSEMIDDGDSNYPGKTYEEGVADGIKWLIFGGDDPFDD